MGLHQVLIHQRNLTQNVVLYIRELLLMVRYQIHNTEVAVMPSLEDGIELINGIGVGELLVTAVDQDGTGEGYNLDVLKKISTRTKVPLIASGGGDSSPKLLEGIEKEYISAVTSSHLFNFMCDGLEYARKDLISAGIELSRWNFEELEKI